MSYSFLFKKAGRVLKSYLDSLTEGENTNAKQKKVEYEDYFRNTYNNSAKSHQSSSQQNYSRESSGYGKAKNTSEIKDEKFYYNVLGLKPGATVIEVKTAYKKLISQYHPDKVVNLGPELQNLAKKKTQELNEAYQYLKKKLNF